MHSLRFRLLVLWTLSLAASVTVALLFFQLYRQSASAQVARADAVIAHACEQIRDRYDFYASGWTGPIPPLSDPALVASLAAATTLALAYQDGVEGGLWQADTGPIAYAYPTYQGSGPKTDLPVAERPEIEAVNRQAARDDLPADRQVTNRNQTLLVRACPVPGPIAGLTAWTMTRIQTAPGFGSLQTGLAVLFGLMVVLAASLSRTLTVWNRHIGGIEATLTTTSADTIPPVQPTGERELDRIIAALNEAGTRLQTARQASAAMAERAAHAERLAGLGRVAAGVAHEIRNPIAAARLQGENALAGDDARRREAIGEMLEQLARLDALATELLAMTQRAAPCPEAIDLHCFIAARIDAHRPVAAAHGVTVEQNGAEGTAWFDPAMIGRILDNLLSNAIRHTLPGGHVTIAVSKAPLLLLSPSGARPDGARDAALLPPSLGETHTGPAGPTEPAPDRAAGLTILVEDTGPGVAANLTGALFEPFVTGRADGTGLGLAIARELADAHGGRLVLRRAGGAQPGEGAIFALELPVVPVGPDA